MSLSYSNEINVKSDGLLGKNILITGANGGIGHAVCQQLLKNQPKSITLACRTLEKSKHYLNQLMPFNFGTTKLIAAGGFEMQNQSQLKQAVTQLDNQSFDVVFVQVGGVFFQPDYDFIPTKAGQIEKTIFQNAIGGYLLIQYLIQRQLLKKNARVIFMGGEGARGLKPLIDKPEFKSIEALITYFEEGPNHKYQSMNAIGVSKLVSALISLKLSELDHQRDYIWFSPGLTAGTQGLDHKPGLGKYFAKYLVFPFAQVMGFAQSPEKAAKKCIQILKGELGDSGDLLGAPKNKALGPICDQKPMNSDFTNQHLRDQLFLYLQKHFGTFTFEI